MHRLHLYLATDDTKSRRAIQMARRMTYAKWNSGAVVLVRDGVLEDAYLHCCLHSCPRAVRLSLQMHAPPRIRRLQPGPLAALQTQSPYL